MPATPARLFLALSLLLPLTALGADAPCTTAVLVELADVSTTVGTTATVSATVRAGVSIPVRVSFVLPPHATVQAGQPLFEGMVGPDAPRELRAVIAPLRAGVAPIAVRVETGDGCRWIAATSNLTVAAAAQRPARDAKPMAAKRPKTKPNHGKVSSQLAKAIQEHKAKGNRGAAAHGVKADAGGKTRVHVRFAEGVEPETLRGRFKSHNAEIEKHRGSIARVRVPLAAIHGLAVAFPEIVQVYIPAPPQPLAVSGQGVAATGANTRHAAGYTGSGTKVMVIDLGFAGLAAAQASGDLPNSGMTLIDCIVGCSPTTFSGEVENHGTAVAEIVHEMAPGAALYLVKIDDELDLADAVDYAGTVGIDIITHSVGWVNYNFYDGQCWFDGPTCSSDTAINTHGILWVNSAGNQAQRHYDGSFVDTNSDEYHDTFITIPNVLAGQYVEAYATWNAWPVTSIDFDLDLIDPTGNVVATGQDWQDGSPSSQPIEAVFHEATTSGNYQLRLYNFDGVAGTRFKIHSFTSNFGNPIVGSSITGPADGTYVVSVAAVRASQYTSSAGLEAYSSRGPATDGVIAPIVAAPTVVSNTTHDGFNGTSASAPHVAGAAAVLLSQHPAWTWVDLWAELVNTAIDMGSPNPDTTFGYGRLNLCTPPSAPTLTAPPNASSGQAYVLTWNGTSPTNSYELEEATNANFTNAVTYNPVGTSFQFIRPTGTTTTYYYRVRAKSACNGITPLSAWSNVATTTLHAACTITNTSQPAGEVWVAGGQVQIRWTKSGDCGANVLIELVNSSGFVVSPIAGSTPNDGEHLWFIPSSLTTGTIYEIRISDLTSSSNAYKVVHIQSAPAGPRPPRADFNGDGKHDLVWRNIDTGRVWVTTVSGGAVTGGFALYTEPNVNWRIIGTGDFNGDGHGDILWRNFATGQVFIQHWANRVLLSAGMAWTNTDPAWRIIDLADFDGDRRTDVLWRNFTTGQVFVQLMTGTTVKASGMVWTEPNLNWVVVAATDLNGDGRADLLYRNTATGSVFIIHLHGVTAATRGLFNEFRDPHWSLATTGDVDGDNDSDLIWRHNTSGQVWITFVNGFNAASTAQIWTENNASWRIQGMGDFDANGRQDLLWRNSSTGSLFLIRLNGPTRVGTGILYTEPNLAWKITSPTTSFAAMGGNVSP